MTKMRLALNTKCTILYIRFKIFLVLISIFQMFYILNMTSQIIDISYSYFIGHSILLLPQLGIASGDIKNFKVLETSQTREFGM